MFAELKHNKEFEEGVDIYKAFKKCLMEARDKPRAAKLAHRIDTWYNKLNNVDKKSFCKVLIAEGLITGQLKAVIEMFDGHIIKPSGKPQGY